MRSLIDAALEDQERRVLAMPASGFRVRGARRGPRPKMRFGLKAYCRGGCGKHHWARQLGNLSFLCQPCRQLERRSER